MCNWSGLVMFDGSLWTKDPLAQMRFSLCFNLLQSILSMQKHFIAQAPSCTSTLLQRHVPAQAPCCTKEYVPKKGPQYIKEYVPEEGAQYIKEYVPEKGAQYISTSTWGGFFPGVVKFESSKLQCFQAASTRAPSLGLELLCAGLFLLCKAGACIKCARLPSGSVASSWSTKVT